MKLFVVLHHTDDPTQGAQFDKVNASHKARGFPLGSMGYYVGYHWFIGFDGSVKQARKEEEVGAHCAAKMMNYVGIGVCLAGDFTEHEPNELQIIALAELLTGIQSRWPIHDDAILLHKECKPTACPGVDLRSRALVRRREMVAAGEYPAPNSSPTAARILSRRWARIVKWLAK